MNRGLEQTRKNFVTEEYGISKNGELQQSNNRLLKRKKEGRSKEHQREFQKKSKESTIQKEKIKYISNCFTNLEQNSSSNTEELSSSDNHLNPKYKRRTSSSPDIKTKILNEEGSISSTSVKSKNEGRSLTQEVVNHGMKKNPEQNKLLNEVERLKRQVVKLKSINDILIQQITLLTRQRDAHASTIKRMQIKCEDFDQSIKKIKVILKSKEIQNKQLRNSITELQTEREERKLSGSTGKNIKEGGCPSRISRIQQEKYDKELENLIEDIYRNFDQIMTESKIQITERQQGQQQGKSFSMMDNKAEDKQNREENGINWGEANQKQIQALQRTKNIKMVFEMQERVKYLEIENKMLMRYKFQTQMLKTELQKQKHTEEMLNRKIKNLIHHDQKISSLPRSNRHQKYSENFNQHQIGGKNRYNEYLGFLQTDGGHEKNMGMMQGCYEESLSFQLSKDEQKS